jgi:hypothetical protein
LEELLKEVYEDDCGSHTTEPEPYERTSVACEEENEIWGGETKCDETFLRKNQNGFLEFCLLTQKVKN